jgi:hypothetical protein
MNRSLLRRLRRLEARFPERRLDLSSVPMGVLEALERHMEGVLARGNMSGDWQSKLPARFRRILGCWLLLGLVFGTLALPTGLPASSTPAAISDSARTASGAVAPELSYTVISSDRDKISKTLKVRLSRTATEAELSQLAVRLKTEQQGAAPKFSVWFFLPDTQLGSHDPAWATANFEPDLRIDIHGLTQDQLAQATASAEKVPKPLGRWIWNYAAGSGPVVIAKVGGRLVLTQQYKDGSTRKLTLKESKSTRGRLFTDVKGSDFGEYFLLMPDGGLEIGDKDGAIGTTTRLKGPQQKEDIQ